MHAPNAIRKYLLHSNQLNLVYLLVGDVSQKRSVNFVVHQ
jgi:hypothetical protein